MEFDVLLQRINDAIINPIIAILFVVALIVFMWGIVKMISRSDNETELATGKRNIVYGLLGMFIMISVFGIMQLIIATFELEAPDGGSPIQSVVE